jgi:hypothetical protein
VVILNPATSGLTTTTITHRGSSNFAVIAYGPGIDLLVNEIGNYQGRACLPTGRSCSRSRQTARGPYRPLHNPPMTTLGAHSQS